MLNYLVGQKFSGKYIQPTPILLPINVLEDFTKPLSLSFRLFGNTLADELVVVVLVSFVPSVELRFLVYSILAVRSWNLFLFVFPEYEYVTC
ncbi:hypothetical protein MIMGU_mgv1a017141mg [Erythranthe guttata]|uniref:Uncharacterized protein n=1 Tax=Erythranthe guttata TaxID=4155 RepID=A0A022QLB8_ERYGU|nr:hypothetical protein MIMGU_mgv1a017141mg [Erythranthe guttata]